jgi:hypothetical protein
MLEGLSRGMLKIKSVNYSLGINKCKATGSSTTDLEKLIIVAK